MVSPSNPLLRTREWSRRRTKIVSSTSFVSSSSVVASSPHTPTSASSSSPPLSATTEELLAFVTQALRDLEGVTSSLHSSHTALDAALVSRGRVCVKSARVSCVGVFVCG